MSIRNGTRQSQSFKYGHPPTTENNGANTRDVGLSKLVTASITFSPTTNHLTGATGTFANFATDDLIEITGTGQNDGRRIVVGIDATNHAYLNVDYPPKTQGPLSATVRSV